ncbi:uncharacterized protein LOC102377384 isoform X2 [Alligator sinensis]|uniref:Uncharacterized protein LOC102377384 isoform X2 n=1 Tax=Alligator sinensis TaxID=38654 RepID=A0A1U7SUC4_ALLSI|nr:uncharacterized protein LOC102377384 isoform X2 [Alligator sinensis]
MKVYKIILPLLLLLSGFNDKSKNVHIKVSAQTTDAANETEQNATGTSTRPKKITETTTKHTLPTQSSTLSKYSPSSIPKEPEVSKNHTEPRHVNTIAETTRVPKTTSRHDIRMTTETLGPIRTDTPNRTDTPTAEPPEARQHSKLVTILIIVFVILLLALTFCLCYIRMKLKKDQFNLKRGDTSGDDSSIPLKTIEMPASKSDGEMK